MVNCPHESPTYGRHDVSPRLSGIRFDYYPAKQTGFQTFTGADSRARGRKDVIDGNVSRTIRHVELALFLPPPRTPVRRKTDWSRQVRS